MATHQRAGTHPDPRSPFVFDVSGLGRRPGSMMEVHKTVSSPSRIGLDLIAIERGADIDLDLRLESVSEGVLVSGTVHGVTSGECARCLGPAAGDIEIVLTELFAYPDSATESITDEDEVGRVIDQTVDIEQAVVDAVVLALPFAPLCSENCPGLCPDCGISLAPAEPDHHHDKVDPRWAKLAGMLDTPERGDVPGPGAGRP